MKITLALAEPTLELLRHCQGSECYDTAYYRKWRETTRAQRGLIKTTKSS